MCIRDRRTASKNHCTTWNDLSHTGFYTSNSAPLDDNVVNTCLLYTSDAADERSSVDLGGRRIIKKKHNIVNGRQNSMYKEQLRMTSQQRRT